MSPSRLSLALEGGRGDIAGMSLSVRMLGTSASRPTVERNVASLAVHREGETLMFDCGEGTQRQMMRYGVSFALEDIFFTHMHADHLLGVIGLIRTMALQRRTERLRRWGPKGAARVPQRAAGVAIEGDPGRCAGTMEASRDADLLIHEATFGDEEAERAIETGHSTAREAAQVARESGVRRLLLTHFSARYSRDAGELEREARQV